MTSSSTRDRSPASSQVRPRVSVYRGDSVWTLPVYLHSAISPGPGPNTVTRWFSGSRTARRPSGSTAMASASLNSPGPSPRRPSVST